MTPAEIPLTLSADVLRLPYTPATRLVLAEIVSLYAANAGCCDASDAHFAARLTINKDTANVAVKLLEKDGLVTKVVTRLPTGFYRTLTPNPAVITAKAATNTYPENTTSPSRNFRVAKPEIPASPTITLHGNSGYPYTEFPATPSRENPLPLAGNSVSNTPSTFHLSSTPSADASEDAEAEKKIEPDSPPVKAQRPASRTRGAGRAEEPEHFAGFWHAWPKKEARADAVKAFAKLSTEDQAAAASRADTWLAARPDLLDPTRYRFIPHATTWLNQARWTDEAAPIPISTTHAAQNPTSHPPRSVNGHKPLGNGGSLARFLVE